MGKEGEISLPTSSYQELEPRPSQPWRKRALATLALSSLLFFWASGFDTPEWLEAGPNADFISTSCHQAEPLLPKSFDPATVVSGQEGRIRDWLSGSVKIPTEMFDVMGPIGEDKRWDIFYNFSSCECGLHAQTLGVLSAFLTRRLGGVVPKNPRDVEADQSGHSCFGIRVGRL